MTKKSGQRDGRLRALLFPAAEFFDSAAGLGSRLLIKFSAFRWGCVFQYLGVPYAYLVNVVHSEVGADLGLWDVMNHENHLR